MSTETRLPTRIPKRLSAGATIGVISPASPPSSIDKIDRGIAYLEGRGFTVVRGSNLYNRNGYLAGTDAERVYDLHAMFDDDAVDAIFCARGGYGVSRLLPLIDYDLIQKKPKILVGYSDLTALSMALWRRCGLVTFAGPMVAADMQSAMPPATEQWFWNMLMAGTGEISIASQSDRGGFEFRGSASGPLVGGTLSVLATLLGTRYEPDWRGAILFLEDVGENIYKIDRLLMHLANANVLPQVAGIVLGSFVSIPEDAANRNLHEVFAEYFGGLNVPVLDDFPFGHVPTKCTLPFGALVTIDTRTRRLTVDARGATA